MIYYHNKWVELYLLAKQLFNVKNIKIQSFLIMSRTSSMSLSLRCKLSMDYPHMELGLLQNALF